jgi:glycosyltransferase involved in cell wall biosynthesis
MDEGDLSWQRGGVPIVAVSHLRWDFIFQRPHHLMTRAARDRAVFYIEEPEFDASVPWLEERTFAEGVTACVPHLAPGGSVHDDDRTLVTMMSELVGRHDLDPFVLWSQTPSSQRHTRHLEPAVTVYDCMDELSLFAGAPARIRMDEDELLERADLVFTGGQALYEAKRDRHRAVHAFPSSVDVGHFAQARAPLAEPADQASIAGPKIGFFGVVDERFDLDLVGAIAERRPDWQFVVVGPVLKIDESSLPHRPNIHFLGKRSYDELPAYLGAWDVAIMPFAMNDATRFISPTKTPEYLAGGKPVVSTPITDVVSPYGETGLVRIAGTVDTFEAAIEASLGEDVDDLLRRADRFLATMSWDRTWREMDALIDGALSRNRPQPLVLS